MRELVQRLSLLDGCYQAAARYKNDESFRKACIAEGGDPDHVAACLRETCARIEAMQAEHKLKRKAKREAR